ncbi:MAG: hypothetical protein NC201_00650 [Prevotella sp.]|nr:hypothetical protein [Bacteroides sp.]MCM1365737.1 hypothetical protein [Prevotella sp.]MCM1436407.1 hypothetical protein [Prevotella sp.]
MKRNILTLGLATLIGCSAFFATDVYARQQRVLSNGELPSVKGIDKNSATVQARALRGSRQLNSIKSVRSGNLDLTRLRPAQQNSATRSIAAPRGHFCGGVGSYSTMETFSQAFFGELNSATGLVTPLFYSSGLINSNDYDIQGGFIRKGIYYTPVLISDTQTAWNRFDIETGSQLQPMIFDEGISNAYAYSMAYNEAEDRVYCLSIDLNTGTDNQLVVFDCADNFKLWSAINLNTSNFVGALAYNPADQQVYAFDDSGKIYIVESGKANMIEQGQFINDVCPIEGGAATQVCYSPLDEAFAIVIRDGIKKVISLGFFSMEDAEDGSYEAWEVVDGPVLSGRNFNTPYFISLNCTDPFAENDAPELPAAPVWNFTDAELTGSISVTIPANYYSGVAIPATEKVGTVVTVDGNEVLKGDFAPGSVQTINQTLTQGEHTVAVTCTTNKEKSPTRTTTQYIGNDNPLAPTNIYLEGDKLTWKAPGNTGAHKGYVDVADLTYDVYFGKTKQNTEPIKGTEYTITPPADLQYVKINVVANAHGLSSAEASIHEVIGAAMNLPVALEPTVQESDLFQVINPRNDDTQWQFIQDNGNEFMCWVGYYSAANDWLFLPIINFPTDEHLYNFAFTYRNAQFEGSESLDMYLSKSVTTDTSDMINIFSQKNMDFPNNKEYSLNFGVPEAGNWYIAIHCTSPGGAGGGVALSNFAVNGLNGVSSIVPGDAQNVEFIPAAEGVLSTTINITSPTKSITGKDLDPNQDITYTITCGKYTTTATCKPGAVATATIDVEKDGFNLFDITPSNVNGTGLQRTYRQYIGLDRPLCPTDIKGEPGADNTTYTLTWQPSPDKGENGGYVDIANLKYNIYNVNGVAFAKLGETKGLTYTVSTPGNQAIYNLGPVAENKIGESRNSQFICDILGKPYELPMVEEFGNTNFSYEPFYLNLTPPYQNCAIQPIYSVISPTYAHNCKQDCDNGAIIIYNTARYNCPGELVLPKFTTKDVTDATISINVLDYAHTPDMSIWARCEGQNELQKVGDLTLEKPEQGKWVDASVVLPQSYLDKGWVQFVIRFALTTDPDEYAFIDGYSVRQNIDLDFGVKSITGPSEVFVGETYGLQIRLVNGGNDLIRQGAGTVIIRLKDKDGNILTRRDVRSPRMTSMQETNLPYSLEVLESYADVSPLTLDVETQLQDDEVAWNNNRSMQINVHANEAPVVHDLSGKWNDSYTEIALDWSTPNMDHSNYDGFELYESGENGQKLGQFQNIDMDKGIPFCFNGLRWEGDALPQAWHIIDVNDIYPFKDDKRLSPHGGSKYLMARTPEYDQNTDENKTQAADWLISPEVIPGSTISFWYGTIDEQYTEYIELWVSSTDDVLGTEINKPNEDTSVGATCGSFRYVRTFSKSGEEAWEYVQQKLPDDAKYFALVYRSYDGFGAMLDDITFDQVGKNELELDKYSIWGLTNDNWETWHLVADNITTDNYIVKDANKDATNTYYVITYIKNGNSIVSGPKSNPARIFGQSVDGIQDASRYVAGGKGVINISGHAGELAKVYAADGKLVREINVEAASASYPSQPGVYVVRIGKSDYKVMVK